MKWIKASERLPEKRHNYHVKMLSPINYHTDEYLWNTTCLFDGKQFIDDINVSQLANGNTVIEWLDESFTQPATDEGLLEALKEILHQKRSIVNIHYIASEALQKYESSKPAYEAGHTFEAIQKLREITSGCWDKPLTGESSKGNEQPQAEKYFNGELIVDHQQLMENKYANEAIPPQSEPLTSEVEEWMSHETYDKKFAIKDRDFYHKTIIDLEQQHERDRKEIISWKILCGAKGKEIESLKDAIKSNHILIGEHSEENKMLQSQLEAKEKEIAELKASRSADFCDSDFDQ